VVEHEASSARPKMRVKLGLIAITGVLLFRNEGSKVRLGLVSSKSTIGHCVELAFEGRAAKYSASEQRVSVRHKPISGSPHFMRRAIKGLPDCLLLGSSSQCPHDSVVRHRGAAVWPGVR
jgi:hypothetical protein